MEKELGRNEFNPRDGVDLSDDFQRALGNYNKSKGTRFNQPDFDWLYSPAYISNVIAGRRGQQSVLRKRVIDFIRKYGSVN